MLCLCRQKKMLQFLDLDELLFDHVDFRCSVDLLANRLLRARCIRCCKRRTRRQYWGGQGERGHGFPLLTMKMLVWRAPHACLVDVLKMISLNVAFQAVHNSLKGLETMFLCMDDITLRQVLFSDACEGELKLSDPLPILLL